jgi:hypothetical protein
MPKFRDRGHDLVRRIRDGGGRLWRSFCLCWPSKDKPTFKYDGLFDARKARASPRIELMVAMG